MGTKCPSVPPAARLRPKSPKPKSVVKGSSKPPNAKSVVKDSWFMTEEGNYLHVDSTCRKGDICMLTEGQSKRCHAHGVIYMTDSRSNDTNFKTFPNGNPEYYAYRTRPKGIPVTKLRGDERGAPLSVRKIPFRNRSKESIKFCALTRESFDRPASLGCPGILDPTPYDGGREVESHSDRSQSIPDPLGAIPDAQSANPVPDDSWQPGEGRS